MVHSPIVLVRVLSTPSTVVHAQLLDSSVLEDTSHKAQMGQMGGSVLQDEEGSGDRQVP